MIHSTRVIVIIPCYNEEKRLLLQSFDTYAKENANVSFLFVNDGSTDTTVTILKDFCTSRDTCSFLDLKKNVGKAEAIRQGVRSLDENHNYDYVGYFDADLATPLSEIDYFISEIEKRNGKILFAMGTRFARMGAFIKRKTWRHLVGRVFATFVSMILKLPIYDTQCGAKLIHKSVVFDLFEDKLITKWLFDVELIARLEQLIGMERTKIAVLEIPLNQWTEIEGSKIKLTDFLKAPFELFKIWRRY